MTATSSTSASPCDEETRQARPFRWPAHHRAASNRFGVASPQERRASETARGPMNRRAELVHEPVRAGEVTPGLRDLLAEPRATGEAPSEHDDVRVEDVHECSERAREAALEPRHGGLGRP